MAKTIYIDADDEITSVIDKIRGLKNSDLQMVVPKRAALTQSIVNLKLLKKQGDLLGKKIILVISDETSRNLASRAGFFTKTEPDATKIKAPVEMEKKEEIMEIDALANVPKSSTKEESRLVPKMAKDFTKTKTESNEVPSLSDIVLKVRKKEQAKEKIVDKEKLPAKKISSEEKANYPPKVALLPKSGIKVFVIFILFSLVACGVIGFLILPRAEIEIKPKLDNIVIDLGITFSENATNNDDSKNIIPGKFVEINKESTEQEFKATGSKEIKTKATGEIIVNNTYSSDPQTLLTGTRFVAEGGKEFVLPQTVQIKGAEVQNGTLVAGQTAVKVEAQAEGPDYNIAPTKFTIPGLEKAKQDKITASSESNFSGGDARSAKVVSSEDIAKANEALQDKPLSELQTEINNQINSGYNYFSETISPEITSETTPAEGEETENFKIKVKIKFATIFYSEKSLAEHLKSKYDARLTKNQYLLAEDLTGVNFTPINFDSAKKEQQGNLHIEKQAVWKIEEEKLIEKLKGLTAKDAESTLAETEGIESGEVKLWPFWVEKVPKLSKKITIQIDSP